MKLGSLFDGSGTAPLAAAMCGIEPAWASEIEPYPIKVTKARFPSMHHLGDITKINGAEAEPVDIICGGSPCQDLSVAGKQKGLQDGAKYAFIGKMKIQSLFVMVALITTHLSMKPTSQTAGNGAAYRRWSDGRTHNVKT